MKDSIAPSTSSELPSSDTTRAASRRQFIATAGAGLISLGVAPAIDPVRPALGAEAPATRPAAAPPVVPLNRFPRMVHEHFVRRVREVERAANEMARDALKTKADAERYVASVRARIRESFGPFPAERTPLDARVSGVVERDAYRIEKVIFESRPGFLVTANLYVPAGRKQPMPGVVGSCGHSANGKAAEPYQSFAQGLARQGYVVLIFDPLGQGERLQYPDEAMTKSKVGVGVMEHLHAGNQQFLVGEFLGTWRAWDGVRALDYLLSRPEVDPKHVGITGNSGGGTMTTWLCGLEQRWTMAAPACFVTTFRRNLENELPADTEQCPPRALALGLDHSDFLAALAPKPVVILAQEKDYFDVRGATEAYERLKRLYALLDAPDNVALHVGPQHHGYSIENRTAMYHWFNRATGVSDAQREPPLVVEKDETLWCTKSGQVAELKSRGVHSFTRETAQSLAKLRKPLEGDALAREVAEVLRLPPRPKPAPDYRILRPIPARGYPAPRFVTYAVETEPGVHAAVYMLSKEALHSRPPKGSGRAVLYVSHHSADAELRDEPLVREVIAAEPEGTAVFACDVRGVGESRPNTCGTDTFLQPYGCDYFYAIHSIMLDEPYVGRKTHDVLCVLDWLKANGFEQVHLVARGWGTPPATFAAVSSPVVAQVTLKNALTSYAALAEAETYRWPLSCLAPNILRRFDLPDCYRALATKKLRQVDPWGPAAG